MFMIAIISVLGISTALADKADSVVPHQTHDSLQGVITEQEVNVEEVEVEDEVVEKVVEVVEVDHSKMNQTEHESEQAEHEGEQTKQTEQGHHKEVAETPPNYKVLGGFAAINLLFIIIGIYLKWFYRKGTSA